MPETPPPSNEELYRKFLKDNNLEVFNTEAMNRVLLNLTVENNRLKFNQEQIMKALYQNYDIEYV